MTTPAYTELVASVRRDGAAIVAAGRDDTGAPVPTCDGWTVRDLVLHVRDVYVWVTRSLTERASTPPPRPDAAAPDADAAAELGDALDELIDAFSACDADTPAWNWSGQDQTASFWARRMAHETAVHRYDAQRARGLAEPVSADIAHDAIDELLDLLLPRMLRRPGIETPPTGAFAFAATDDGGWTFRLDGAELTRLDTVKEPDVTVEGTASALLLGCWRRTAG